MAGRATAAYDVYVFAPGLSRERRAATTPEAKERLSLWSLRGETHKRKATRAARGHALAYARSDQRAGWVGETFIAGTNRLFHQWRIDAKGMTRRGTIKLVAVTGSALAATKPAAKKASKSSKRPAQRSVAKIVRGSARRSSTDRSLKRSTKRPMAKRMAASMSKEDRRWQRAGAEARRRLGGSGR